MTGYPYSLAGLPLPDIRDSMRTPETAEAAYKRGWREAMDAAVTACEQDRPTGHSWAWAFIRRLQRARDHAGQRVSY